MSAFIRTIMHEDENILVLLYKAVQQDRAEIIVEQ